jgi:hypothetical protein
MFAVPHDTSSLKYIMLVYITKYEITLDWLHHKIQITDNVICSSTQ